MECLRFDIKEQTVAVTAEICTQNKAQCSKTLHRFSRLFSGTKDLANFWKFGHYLRYFLQP